RGLFVPLSLDSLRARRPLRRLGVGGCVAWRARDGATWTPPRARRILGAEVEVVVVDAGAVERALVEERLQEALAEGDRERVSEFVAALERLARREQEERGGD